MHIDGHGLTIRQCRAKIQSLAGRTGLQTQAHIGEGQRIALPGMEGHLTVEDIDPAQLSQALQDLGGVQRRIVLAGQPFERPCALFVLTQDQLQTAQLDTRQTQFARFEAGPQVRNGLDFIQAQCRGALAHLQVAHPQHRCQATPASLEGTDMHRQPQGLLGLAFYFGTVFGHQGDQFPTEADVQRHQHRQQGAETQPPAGQGA
ncbi:Uncharacterised protein [Pseudomonas putida]|nr:Uncharacterised protein [Pseudomonas putida]CAB5695970.1 Uncharacterised protein [Pseudomonas putida]